MPLDEQRQQRIVITHTGSLPRPRELSALLFSNQPDEAAERTRATHQAVTDIVARQLALGVDVVSDGEQSKVSFQVYALDRLTGLEPIQPLPGARRTRENTAFPTFYRGGVHPGSAQAGFACTGPIAYKDQAQLAADIGNLKAALQERAAIDAFMPSVSPSSLASLVINQHYPTEEEFVLACAEAMRVEYETIVAAGFQLQIDDPRLAMHYMLSPDQTVEQTRAWTRQRIEILNHALRNIPPERVRHHTCYGINIGPRVSDFELKHLADLILQIRAKYYSFEMANPRHEHEWRVWQTVALPEDKVLVPGCITHASVIVEHPELVAERIVRLAGVVGRERVMASTDCGFASTLNPNVPPEVEPEIVWAKFQSLVTGARLASNQLWG
jgi:5-methyltetrahydropteroyltriglutamate--homocysteine methyltransferase